MPVAVTRSPAVSAKPVLRQRIESIDMLRGLVMVIMAIDHARMYFGPGTLFSSPSDVATTTTALFLTRWVTHFCAPVFVLLSGTAAYLYGVRAGVKALSHFLLTRGLWLLVVEATLVTFGWTFDVTFSRIWVQVIWAIGFSMICLAGLVHLPRLAILVIGGALALGHHVLDPIKVQGSGLTDVIWYLLHQPSVVKLTPDFALSIQYPVLPWIGVMALGYLLGRLFVADYDPVRRKRWLLGLGVVGLLAFGGLRMAQMLFGSGWGEGSTPRDLLLNLLNIHKYPPSLLFLLLTLGPALIFLGWVEKFRNRVTDFFIVFGRVPFFYYLLHIYLIHALAMLALAVTGQNPGVWILDTGAYASQSVTAYGYGLGMVYGVWMVVIVACYPLCRWYGQYKADHREKWWLSYL